MTAAVTDVDHWQRNERASIITASFDGDVEADADVVGGAGAGPGRVFQRRHFVRSVLRIQQRQR